MMKRLFSRIHIIKINAWNYLLGWITWDKDEGELFRLDLFDPRITDSVALKHDNSSSPNSDK